MYGTRRRGGSTGSMLSLVLGLILLGILILFLRQPRSPAGRKGNNQSHPRVDRLHDGSDEPCCRCSLNCDFAPAVWGQDRQDRWRDFALRAARPRARRTARLLRDLDGFADPAFMSCLPSNQFATTLQNYESRRWTSHTRDSGIDRHYGGHRKPNELHSSRRCAGDKSRRSRPWLSKRREPQAQAAERRALKAHPPVIGVENVLNQG